MQLTVNGKIYQFEADLRSSLLDVLRESLQLTGTKKGCDHGQCGACTILVNGIRINSCLSLAIMHQRDELTTVEGLASSQGLHPLQQAFIDEDALQCGYCTPGQLCSAAGLLREIQSGDPSHVTADLENGIPLTELEISERMSGNLCRCAAYPRIRAAVLAVARDESGR